VRHFLKSHKRNDNLDELDTYIENQGEIRASFKYMLKFQNFFTARMLHQL
jgi:hypothetical protein